MSNQRFYKNLQLWASLHPREATLLPYHEDPSLKAILNKNGQENLVREENGKKYFFHSNKDAIIEAEKWASKLDLGNKDVVYIFGVGLGYYYDALKKWLKGHPRRYVVFLENDLGVIYHFLETKRASTFLKDPQAALYYFSDLKSGTETFDSMYWNYILTQMVTTSLKLYEQTQSELTQELFQKLIYDAAIKNALVEEYLRFGANFFKNFYANILYLSDSYLGNKMFGQFKGIPAIICGAGPSLDKALPHLQELRQRAIIFAGGSSLNALNNANILPHFGGGIDPNPTQLDRLSTSSGFEVPFFYRNRLLPQAFRKIHGPKLYITGSGGYNISDFFEEKLGIAQEEFLDEGHNIVNFCLQIANQLKCNPIVFVGMDLGFTGMKTYATGIEADVKVSKKKLSNTGDFDKDALLRKDIHGNPFYTLWKWIAEADWISDYGKTNPSVTLINCTEDGLGFPDIPNMPLMEAADLHFTHEYDIAGRIHAAIQQSHMEGVTEEKVEELVEEMYQSIMRSIEHLTIMIEEAEVIKERIKKDKAVPAIMQTGKSALAEHELSEEPAYEFILDLFNNVYSRILSIELKRIRLSRTTEARRALRRMDVNIRRMVFLKDVLRVNAGVIDLARKAKEQGDMFSQEYLQTTGVELPSLKEEETK